MEAKPGFSMPMLGTLKKKAAAEPAIYSTCTLMIDAMAIRQTTVFDQHQGKMVGFVDLGSGADDMEEAKEVLVLMAVGTTGHWKMPLAFFFTRSLSGEAQHQLVTYALQYLNEAGVRVIALTMDGHATNTSMCRLFGCSLDPHNMKSSFTDPASNRTIYVIFDACHMLKLARNLLEATGSLESSFGQLSWSFIRELQNLQV